MLLRNIMKKANNQKDELNEEKKLSGFMPVLLAILGNFAVTILKFIAFILSGSGVMFSEAVHSFADTANQSLIMIGLRRSTKKSNDDFDYGFGMERFFWALISACGIFFIGAGVTIASGVRSLFEHHELEIGVFSFVVLGISFVVESITFGAAVRELLKLNPDKKFGKILKNGDPTTIAVFYEDGVALLGIIIALLSIILTKTTGYVFWDAVGSIIIGILLGFVAIVLINKNRQFLLGKSLPEKMEKKIIKIIEADPAIEKVFDFKSKILDINKYIIKCEVEFNSPALIREAFRNGLADEYEMVKESQEEFMKFCVDHTDRVPRLIGKRIDEIERKIQIAFPDIKYIDIEIN